MNPNRPWARPVAIALVGIVAWAMVWPGLSARDLTGDELGVLAGPVAEILHKALNPAAEFSGHMPFSYLLRWLSLEVLDPTDAIAWRLPSALAFAAAAMGIAWIPQRIGLGVLTGLLLILSPIASFHGQESSNYAWTLLASTVVLYAVIDPNRRRKWLVVGLFLAMFNDLYGVWIGLGALLACGLSERLDWRRVGAAWALVAAVAVPLMALIAYRLWMPGETGGMSSHADLAASELGVLDDIYRRLQRFGGANLGGYAAGRETDLWEQIPAVLFPCMMVALALRSAHRWARASAWMFIGAMASALLFGGVFLQLTGRVLPMEPRALMGIIPPFTLVLVGGIAALPGRASQWVSGLIVLLMGSATLDQQLNRSTMHTDAAETIAAGLAEGEGIVAEPRIQWRLIAAGVDADRIANCLYTVPEAWTGLWWVNLQPLELPLDRRACEQSGQRQTGWVDLSGWSVLGSWTQGPPAHERSAAGFLRPVSIVHYKPGIYESAAPSPLGLERAFLDGMGGSTIGTFRIEADGSQTNLAWTIFDENPIAKMPTDPLLLERVMVEMRPRFLALLPEWSFFDAMRRSVQRWELLLMAPQVQMGSQTLVGEAMREPLWRVARRLGVVALLLLLSDGLFRRREP